MEPTSIYVMTKQLKVTPAQWNKEFSSGRWDCLDSNPTERARHAMIGMYCQKYFPKGSILDVGCGEGTLIDFLNNDQRKNYLGIDISFKAIKIAKSKRKLNFQCVAAEDFKTRKKFDAIIFNEVLYYLDDVKIFEQYSMFLKNKSIVIMSLYRMGNKRYDKLILRHSKKFFKLQEAVEIVGIIKKQKVTWRIEVMK